MFQLSKERYQYEIQRITQLDTKAGSIIAYITIVTGLTVGLGSFSLLGKLTALYYYVPYFTGIGLLIWAIFESLSAIRLRDYTITPGELWPMDWLLRARKTNADTKLLYTEMIIAYGDATLKNRIVNEKKTLHINRSWVLLIFGIVALLIFVAIFAVTGNLNPPPSNDTADKLCACLLNKTA